MRFGKIDDIKSRVAAAIDASRQYLFSLQDREDGYWCGELGADTTLVSDYILLHRLLGTEDEARTQKCAVEILNRQNHDGGWPIYNDGPSNISASVKAYFALKMAGYSPDHPQLQKARERILALGGVTEVNTFTKIYLCFLGQYDYDAVPAIPPEIVLFPNWFWFNIYEISSWSRAILVPLSIAYAKKPFKKIPTEQGIDELFVGGRSKSQTAAALGEEDRQLAQFLPGARPADSLLRAGTRSPAALAGAEGRGKMDAGAPGDERRSGRDLSRHHELHHRAALPGLFARRSAGDPRHGRVREAGHRGRDDLPHAALHVAGVGHGLRGVCAGGERSSRQRSAAGAALRVDAEEAGHAPGRLVREESQSRARRAGISSSTTSSIPTWTTARRCCWR